VKADQQWQETGDTGNGAAMLGWQERKLIGGTITRKLPAMFADDPKTDILDDLIGAQIVSFGEIEKAKGCFDDKDCMLGIEYIPNGKKEAKRIILAFDDRGMWIEFESENLKSVA
jgi:hypothetical protein